LRPVFFDTEWIDTPVFERAELGSGLTLRGPAVIDEMSATTLVPPGAAVSVDRAGNLVMELPLMELS
jgi:N-methylhydantoinase A